MRICIVPECNREKSISNKHSKYCEIHRYNWYRYKSFERPPKKLLPIGIVHICKVHGELTQDQACFQKKGEKKHYKCRTCRNKSAQERLNKTKYIYTPKKHIKTKLPSFVKPEDKSHAYTMFHRFKVTAQQYRDMQEKQNYLCAICKKTERMKKKKTNKIKMLCIDHCHKKEEEGIIKIRGLLCHQCNLGLGAFDDSIELLLSAIDYLKASN